MIRPVPSSEKRSSLRFIAAAVAFLIGPLVGGCSMPLADLPLVGLPENTPPRPATPAAYLPVHDIPAPRGSTVLTPAEQAKIEKELAAERDRLATNGSKQTNRRVIE